MPPDPTGGIIFACLLYSAPYLKILRYVYESSPKVSSEQS